MDFGLAGRTALVVGGARGIGRAAAARLAGEKTNLILADLDGAAVEKTAAEIAAASGVSVRGISVDLRNAEQVEALIAQAGAVDILVNSAAVLDDKLFLDSTERDWQRMIDVCLFGPMRVLRALLPSMVERKYGRVICLASDAGRIGQARLSYYAAAKAGVIALIKSIAQEIGASGVTLNVVSPGATNTELRQERERGLLEQMGAEKYARREQTVLRMYPLRRIGEPDDIASAIAFLASDRASWITGQVLSVNGGFVMP